MANRDLVMRTYEQIIDIVGLENIALLLPCWETEGSELRDMLNPHKGYSLFSNPILGSDGLLHGTFDTTSTAWARQRGFTENYSAKTGDVNLTSGGHKVAQKVVGASGVVSAINIEARRVGTISGSDALKITIREDDAGSPGSVIADGESLFVTANLPTGAGRYAGVPFPGLPKLLASETYWITLEYETATTIDSSNYVAVSTSDDGDYGEGISVYDGASWTGTAGEDLRFTVLDDSLVFGDDASVIAVINNKNESTSITNALGSTSVSGQQALQISLSGGNLRFAVRTDEGVHIAASPSGFLPNQNIVVGGTFSKSAAKRKLLLYCNGKEVGSADGTAGQSIQQFRFPLYIGAVPDAFGYRTGVFKGVIGPVLFTKTTLSPSQQGEIVNQLMLLRRLRAGV